MAQISLWCCKPRSSAWTAPLRFAEKALLNLPTHRDSRSGRQRAKQIRATLMVIGIIVGTLAPRHYLPAGIALILCALALPLEEGRRRALVSKVRTKRKNQVRVDASLVSVQLSQAVLEVHDAQTRRHRIRLGKIKAERETRGNLESLELQRKPVRISLLHPCDPKIKIRPEQLAESWKKAGSEFLLADDDLWKSVLEHVETNET